MDLLCLNIQKKESTAPYRIWVLLETSLKQNIKQIDGLFSYLGSYVKAGSGRWRQFYSNGKKKKNHHHPGKPQRNIFFLSGLVCLFSPSCCNQGKKRKKPGHVYSTPPCFPPSATREEDKTRCSPEDASFQSWESSRHSLSLRNRASFVWLSLISALTQHLLSTNNLI